MKKLVALFLTIALALSYTSVSLACAQHGADKDYVDMWITEITQVNSMYHRLDYFYVMKCSVCGKEQKLDGGYKVEEHNFVNGKCTVCGRSK